jgi:3-oxoacyl-[acyl-carrier-protein] synthase II
MGCVRLITTLLAIRDNIIPPTINYSAPDPECDLDYVLNKARSAKINNALINSFCNGGGNISLLVKRYK